GYQPGSLIVGRPDAAGQTIDTVIGLSNKVSFVFKGKHARHWPENLFPHACGRVAQAADDGRQIVATVLQLGCIRALATDENIAAFGTRGFNITLDALALGEAGERPHFGTGDIRQADSDLGGTIHQQGAEAVVHATLYRQTRTGNTRLAA